MAFRIKLMDDLKIIRKIILQKKRKMIETNLIQIKKIDYGGY